MRLKHNKKRNTAFVYEVLVRELTESVIKNNKNKQNKVVSIIKEHFGKNTTLNRELNLYKTIYETKKLDKRLAEKVIVEVKQKYSDLDKKVLFKEQTDLINKINKTLSNKVFNNFVPNYKNIASVYSIFQDKLPIKDRVLLEENMIEQMSSSVGEIEKETQVPMDSIVYHSFVKKFNDEYEEMLSEGQKNLLNRYISSFADNGLELKGYLNEEIGNLKDRLKKCKRSKTLQENEDLLKKVDAVYEILESSKDREIDQDLIEIVLKVQNLVEEIETNGTIS